MCAVVQRRSFMLFGIILQSPPSGKDYVLYGTLLRFYKDNNIIKNTSNTNDRATTSQTTSLTISVCTHMCMCEINYNMSITSYNNIYKVQNTNVICYCSHDKWLVCVLQNKCASNF